MVALTLNVLWTNSADNKLVLHVFSCLIIFPYFSQEKCFKVSSAEIFNQIMLSIDQISSLCLLPRLFDTLQSKAQLYKT